MVLVGLVMVGRPTQVRGGVTEWSELWAERDRESELSTACMHQQELSALDCGCDVTGSVKLLLP